MDKREYLDEFAKQIAANYAQIEEYEGKLIGSAIEIEWLFDKLLQQEHSQKELAVIKQQFKEKKELFIESQGKISELARRNRGLVYNHIELCEKECEREAVPYYYSLKIKDFGITARTRSIIYCHHWTDDDSDWHIDRKGDFVLVQDIIWHMIEQFFRYDGQNIIFENVDNAFPISCIEEICYKLEEFGYHHENIDIILKKHEIWQLGLPAETVRILISAGYRSKEQIRNTPDTKLRRIRKIGKKKIAQIRAATA